MTPEPIKLPEPNEVVPKPKNKFKPLAIVFIILTVLFALAAGFFVWQWLDQKSQIETLKNDISKIQSELDSKKDQEKEKENANKNSNIVTVEELMRAYKDANRSMNTSGLVINIGNNIIKNSSISPWQTIEVGMGHKDAETGWGGAFYRYGPTESWKYAFGGQGVTKCDNFTNAIPNVWAAFADWTCYGDGTPEDGGLGPETTVGAYFGLE